MPALTIYGTPRARTVRTLWMAEELGLPYENVPVATADGGTRAPSFLAVNPNGRVPAIDDGGFVLWESMAINLYLAKKYAADALYPRSIEHEALAWQWSFWAVTEVDGPIVQWAFHTAVLPEPERDPAKAEAALAALERPLRVLDGALAARPYLADPAAFTVADLNVASVMYRALWMDLAAATPHAADWLARCWSRPAARRARALRE